MLRLSLIALLLMPGIAHAQKFLKVGEPDPGLIAARPSGTGDESATDGGPGSDGGTIEDAEASPLAEPGTAAIELPDFLLPPDSDGLPIGPGSDPYARVQTAGAGAPVLELATFGLRDDPYGAQSFLTEGARTMAPGLTGGLD